MNKDDNSKYAKYGIDYVTRTCDKFGPRFSATEAENAAIYYLEDELKQYCDKTLIDEFGVTPNLYPRGFILMAGIFTLIGTPFFFFKSPISIIAAVLPIFGLFAVWLTFFLMSETFAFLFKKGTSHNATGRIFPRNEKGEKKEAKKRVIVCGHIDSAYQMNITDYGDDVYKVAVPGFLFMGLQIILGVVKVIVFSTGSAKMYAQALNGYITLSIIDVIFLVVAVFGLPCFIFLIRGLTGGEVTLGANDNLSGIATALGLGMYFTEEGNRLNNVELWIGGFGSEECGERGAKAFVDKYGEMGLLDDAIAVIPDSSGAGDRLTIISKEKIHYATHDMKVCEDLLAASEDFAEELGIDPHADPNELKKHNLLPCNIEELPFAASDAGRFSLAGYSAASIIIFEGQLSKPKYWHNKLDRPENLEMPAMTTSFGLLKHFVLNLEHELGNNS